MKSKKEIKRTFIVYLDDNDSIKKVWVELLSTENGFITFLTSSQDDKHKNKVSIPTLRVLKMKSKEENDD